MSAIKEKALKAVAVMAECEAESAEREGDHELAKALKKIGEDLMVSALVLKRRREIRESAR